MPTSVGGKPSWTMGTAPIEAHEKWDESMIFQCPLRGKAVGMGSHMIRVARISKLILEIDGEEFPQKNGSINWKGYHIEVRLEDRRIDIYLPNELALEIGLTLPAKEEEAEVQEQELVVV